MQNSKIVPCLRLESHTLLSGTQPFHLRPNEGVSHGLPDFRVKFTYKCKVHPNVKIDLFYLK